MIASCARLIWVVFLITLHLSTSYHLPAGITSAFSQGFHPSKTVLFTSYPIQEQIITPDRKLEEKISFSVAGDPIPLARHRLSRRRIYNPTAKEQQLFADAANKYLPKEPWDGPLKVKLLFYFKRPKHHYRTGKFADMLKEDADYWHVKRKGKQVENLFPITTYISIIIIVIAIDLDNLVKFVLDALNKKAYIDDSQICIINTAKLYTDDRPRTEVVISKIYTDDILEF
jgi:Holliday junction resolvase RusA-like endonuclease